jgi:hypothetical protein
LPVCANYPGFYLPFYVYPDVLVFSKTCEPHGGQENQIINLTLFKLNQMGVRHA